MNVYFQEKKAGATPPKAQTTMAAGYDLTAVLPEDVVIMPLGRAAVTAGCGLAIPAGMVGFICPRSGMALKDGLTVLNAPGVIDGDFRGEIKVILFNAGDKPFTVKDGMRVAQMVFLPYFSPIIMVVDNLDSTERGEGGFGSTGVA